ncbi:hypothetical protein DSO57_1006205 [Entomophthora muscae]|uniref:Uncharacterized protein n=1 Tax=Entomophthora muscae TaxID=34485 RepID=A0ACC2S9L0_9FUNG|nr:hypothetical protein DSO57_1006205 [Entomophthora muscae]
MSQQYLKRKSYFKKDMKLLYLICGLVSLVAGDKVVVGYYVPWGKVSPSELSYHKVTHINYGFGVLKNRGDPSEISFDEFYDGNALKGVIQGARKNNVKVLISLGGWTGSQTFSNLVASPAHRSKLINNTMVYLSKGSGEPGKDGWGLDGVDIDWEYPGRKAAACNDFSPTFEANDSDNYLKLLQELRKAMDDKFGKGNKLLTAAVRVTPFDKNGVPMNDVSAFAREFDFINIMAYDINGPWNKTTGANAPFDSKNTPSYKQSIDDWVSAMGDPNKVVAGLSFYGRTLTTKGDMDGSTISVETNGQRTKGDDMDSNLPNAICNEGSIYSGVYRYRKLRENILTDKTTAGAGYTRYFDKASQTPYLFNKAEKKFISYDDVESLKIKVDHAKAMNLRGVMYWDMTQDYKDELLDVLQPFKQM